MNRAIVYPGEVPADTDWLNAGRFTQEGLAKLAAAILGTGVTLNGFPCAPGAGLSVQVGAGEAYELLPEDATSFGSLPAIPGRQLLKQGILRDPVTLATPAPTTVGQSINYLIQIAAQEVDGGSVVLPYYNSANPAQTYSGPSNSGAPNYTERDLICAVQVKAGAPASTGSQGTPGPDGGFVAAYVVTVDAGQTAVAANHIALAPNAPFLTERLQEKIGIPTGDARYLRSIGEVVLTTSGPWIAPITGRVRARCQAPGGGAAGGTSAQSTGGAAAGGYCEGIFNVVQGVSYLAVIGAPGVGGTSGMDGTSGGTASIFGLSATGGGLTSFSAAAPAGGTPGVGSGGTLNISGGYGGDGSPNNNIFGGDGGASYFGGGGRGAANGVGVNGPAPGSGGGGNYGAVPGTGGSGAPGLIIIDGG